MVNAKGAENVSLQFVKDSRARKEETKLHKINCCMEEELLSSNPGFNKTFGIYGAGIACSSKKPEFIVATRDTVLINLPFSSDDWNIKFCQLLFPDQASDSELSRKSSNPF